MTKSNTQDAGRAVEHLVGVLAFSRPSSRVLERLVEAPRPILRAVLGSLGHLLHYGADAPVRALFSRLESALRKHATHEGARWLPGERVELVHASGGLRAGEFVVRHHGDGHTIDIAHHSLSEDYVIFTVETDALRKIKRRRSGAATKRSGSSRRGRS